MTETDPLADVHPDTVHSLIEQVRTYIDETSGEYRSTPRERRGSRPDSLGGDSYVSGRDVDLWSGRLATFRTKWEARPEGVRAAILALAYPPQVEPDVPPQSDVLAAAVAQWCEDTCNEVDSDEARDAAEQVAVLGSAEVQAATLLAASELYTMDRRLDASLRLDELDVLRLVITAVSEGSVTSRDRPESMDFVKSLIGLFPSEQDAAEHALGLTRGWLELDGRPDFLESCPADARDLEEVRQWCMSTAPGHEWFWVDGVGCVLYRSGNC